MSCSGPDHSEITLGDDTEGADGGQGTAILAVQFVDPVTIDHQLALLAARQVEVVHQAVARIAVVPVAPAHTRAAVRRRIPLAVSRDHPIERRTSPLLAWALRLGCP